MKRYLLIASLLFLSSYCFAQKQNNVWYFGVDAGVTFNSGTPLALKNGVMNQTEGTSVMCDNNGNLLFFTDGVSVWNRNLQLMPNGTGLLGNSSATQSALIVPEPGNCNIYFIVTVSSQFLLPTIPLSYSVVDMSLNGGLGDISSKNNPLYLPVTERLAATLQSNGKDYWIVSQAYGTNGFVAFSVTSSGINTTPVISFSGPVLNEIMGYYNAIGYMKFSPDGSKLCYANSVGRSQLFDFNNATGVVSNNVTLVDSLGYGVEFSPDNSKLYVSTWHPYAYIITQYDLSAGSASAIQNSATKIVNEKYNADLSFKYGGALQLGPDNKIYSAVLDEYFLSVINKPDLPGKQCKYADTGIILSNQCLDGLPNNIKQFGSTSSCSLPLTVENFEAAIKEKSTQLSWTTFDEVNTASDIVERSYDGIHFSAIAALLANGSTQMNYYNYTDHPSFNEQKVYYRIEFKDKDGATTYSKIIMLPLNGESFSIIQNPVQNVLQLQINISSSQTNTISVFDFSGRRIKTFNAQNGVQHIDVSFLASGIYVLQMITADGEMYNKVFVKR
jgi:hypothetical protein